MTKAPLNYLHGAMWTQIHYITDKVFKGALRELLELLLLKAFSFVTPTTIPNSGYYTEIHAHSMPLTLGDFVPSVVPVRQQCV